jgi:hypothetical protein
VKIFLKVAPYYKDDLSETRLQGVEYGIIQQDLAGFAKPVHLFEPAVTAPHTGRQHSQNWFHIRSCYKNHVTLFQNAPYGVSSWNKLA